MKTIRTITLVGAILASLASFASLSAQTPEYDVRDLHGPEQHQAVMNAVEADIDALEAEGNVTTADILDGTVATADLGSAAVTGAKIDADALTPWIVTAADSSGGAQSLSASGVVATLRVMAAINLTDGVVANKAHFTPGTDAFSQAQAAGNINADKILIFTLPAGS